MNNVALDVAIGLTFVYLLYSLLATTIKELIATIFSFRSKMLELGLQQMLDGNNVEIHWWDRFFHRMSGSKSQLMEKQKLIKGFFATSIVNHPIYKRSGRALTKKPSYLNASTFSDILVDMFHTNKSIPVLLKDVKQELDNKLVSHEINQDLHSILNMYIQQANGDVQRFRWLVENWFNDMMDRVSGWYKRQANWILLLIGFVMALIFNASTIDIVNRLSIDKNARDALVQNASDYLKNHVKISDSATTNSRNSKDSIQFMADARSKIRQIDNLYNEEIANNNSIVGAGWPDVRDPADSLKKGNLNFKVIRQVLSKTFSSPRKWLGFLITALAISLGAPFWFDLLNKFINLRVSGKKPDDDSGPAPTKTTQLNQVPDTSAIG